jgi:hypothetical protein
VLQLPHSLINQLYGFGTSGGPDGKYSQITQNHNKYIKDPLGASAEFHRFGDYTFLGGLGSNFTKRFPNFFRLKLHALAGTNRLFGVVCPVS